jgi:predicted  nucleic acid-binding Zn-ribbon protein
MPNSPVTMIMLQAFEEKWMKKLETSYSTWETTSNLQQRVSTLETENLTLKTAYTSRQQRVSTLESENSTLKTGNTSLQQRVSTLETAKSTLENNSTNLRERITNLEMFATHSLSILVEISRY